MKMLRVLLLLVVGCLSGLSTSVSAETIPATSSGTSPVQGYTRVVGGSNKWYNTLEALCTSQNRTVSSNGSYPDGCCYDATSGICFGPGALVSRCPAADGADVVWPVGGVCQPHYSCPSGQGWTLSGTSCTRPDCVSPQVRLSNGQCSAPCDGALQTKQTDGSCTCDATSLNSTYWGRPWFDGTGDFPSVVCDGGCARSTGFGLGGGGKYSVEATDFTGATCGGTTRPTQKQPIVNHTPKCSATEGVMTSSSGTVACVPQGTPDARTPVVWQSKKVETFSDNSTKTTETTNTTDPLTGVSDNRSTITTSGGLAGSAGTSTSVQSSGTGTAGTGTGTSGSGGDGTCDPKKDFCGGPTTTGIYTKKTKTVESVMTTFKDGVIASPIGSAITGFFNVTVSSGSCPDWSVDVPVLATRLDIGQHFCTANAIAMMELAGNVLLIGFSIVGFRWAIL